MSGSPQRHQSDARILRRRTLERDHRHLASMLRPGLSVLDVGCGTGAITAGIAKAVGAGGRVVGIDRDPGLLGIAKNEHAAIANLRFELGDVTALQLVSEFHIVTAARTLQWISNPQSALEALKHAGKAGALVVVLDYNHVANTWYPDPPPEFRRFYDAFLAWRTAHGWDNEMAAHLPGLFEQVGLIEVEIIDQSEVAERGDAGFEEATDLWPQVVEHVGSEICKEAFFAEAELNGMREQYVDWARDALVKQTLIMQTIVGRVS